MMPMNGIPQQPQLTQKEKEYLSLKEFIINKFTKDPNNSLFSQEFQIDDSLAKSLIDYRNQYKECATIGLDDPEDEQVVSEDSVEPVVPQEETVEEPTEEQRLQMLNMMGNGDFNLSQNTDDRNTYAHARDMDQMISSGANAFPPAAEINVPTEAYCKNQHLRYCKSFVGSPNQGFCMPESLDPCPTDFPPCEEGNLCPWTGKCIDTAECKQSPQRPSLF
jgi:hypothetical protein